MAKGWQKREEISNFIIKGDWKLHHLPTRGGKDCTVAKFCLSTCGRNGRGSMPELRGLDWADTVTALQLLRTPSIHRNI